MKGMEIMHLLLLMSITFTVGFVEWKFITRGHGDGISSLSGHAQHKPTLFYVDSIHGNDSWSGTRLERDGQQDGPFKTIYGAIKSASRLIPSKKVTIYLRGGIHYVEKTIYIGKKESHLVIAGYPKDKRPIISGAIKIPGQAFKKRGQVWASSFNGKCSKHVFLGTKRLIRARKPNLRLWNGDNLSGEGPYLTIKDLLLSTPTCNRKGSGGFTQSGCPPENKNGFIFKSGDINSDWLRSQRGNPPDILVFEAWTAERGTIKTITSDNKVLFSNPLIFPVGLHPQPSGWRYVVENVFDELDAVGEFFCDENHKVLYIIPPNGALESEDVFVSQTETLFSISGAVDVAFTDVEFRHTISGEQSFQSQMEQSYSRDSPVTKHTACPGLFQVTKSSEISFHDSHFMNIGHTGLFFEDCTNVKIWDCSFRDIGYFGVSALYINGNPQFKLSNSNFWIAHNTFRGCGVSNMFQPSCMLIQGVRNITISHNDISHSPYAGIRVGWQSTFSSGYVPSHEYVFYVERNHVHNYGNGILNDFAGVYLSSNMMCHSAARRLSQCFLHAFIGENSIHDAKAYNYGGNGIYGDTAVSALTVKNNWIYKLSDCSINFHCGQRNRAINNMIHHNNKNRIFGTCKSIGPGAIPVQLLTFKRNVIYVTNTSARMFGEADYWKNEVPSVNRNDYYFHPFSKADFDVFFPKYRSWENWRNETGNDQQSILKNPRFRSIRKNDYRLKKKSPVFAIGIKSVDLRKIQNP